MVISGSPGRPVGKRNIGGGGGGGVRQTLTSQEGLGRGCWVVSTQVIQGASHSGF